MHNKKQPVHPAFREVTTKRWSEILLITLLIVIGILSSIALVFLFMRIIHSDRLSIWFVPIVTLLIGIVGRIWWTVLYQLHLSPARLRALAHIVQTQSPAMMRGQFFRAVDSSLSEQWVVELSDENKDSGFPISYRLRAVPWLTDNTEPFTEIVRVYTGAPPNLRAIETERGLLFTDESYPALYGHTPYASVPSSPPRKVPLIIRWQLLWGNISLQILWVLLLIPLCFFQLQVATVDAFASFRFTRPLAEATAEVVKVHEADGPYGLSPGERMVMAYEYEFYDATHRLNTGISYQAIRDNEQSTIRVGKKMPVEYRAKFPNISRLQGMRSRPNDDYVAFWIGCVTLAFICLFFYLPQTKRERLLNHLLRKGIRVPGKRIGVPGLSRIKGLRTMMYAFHDVNGKRHTVRLLVSDPLLYGSNADMLYDPQNPARATALPQFTDRMPYTIDDQGQFHLAWNWGLLWVAIPLMVSCGYLSLVYFLLRDLVVLIIH